MSDIYSLPGGEELLLHQDYTRGNANGVTALVVASCLSLVAVVGLLAAISLSAFNTRRSTDQLLFVRTHVAAYFVSLLIGDLLQSIGSIMSARWVSQMRVDADTFCTIQGVIKQASDVSVALWTLIIAIHTFCLLFLRMKLKGYVLWATLISGWSAIAAIVIAGPAALNTEKYGPFFGISGYWCWITPAYDTERVTLDYMIMFIAAFSSFILYTLVYLRLRGNIIVNGWHLRFRFIDSTNTASWRGRQIGDNKTLQIARQMLLYPVAYTILILPIAAARFSVFAGKSVPFGVTIFCDTIFLLDGAVNVFLFTSTRRILPPKSIIGKFISRPEPQRSDDIENDPDSYYRSAGVVAEKSVEVEVQRDTDMPIFKRSDESFRTGGSDTGSELSLPMEHHAPRVQPAEDAGPHSPPPPRPHPKALSIPEPQPQQRLSPSDHSSPERSPYARNDRATAGESLYNFYDYSRDSRYPADQDPEAAFENVQIRSPVASRQARDDHAHGRF